MKKTISMVLLLSLCCALCLCSCGQKSYPMAESFNSPQIENSFNNNLAGARMGYKNNTLYCPKYYNEILFKGVYAVNSNGCEIVVEGDKTPTDLSCNPFFYEYDNDLILDNIFTDERYKIQGNHTLIPVDYDFYHYGTDIFVSDDYIIYYSDSATVNVKIKDKDEFPLLYVTSYPIAFYPYGDELYVMNGSGWLYKTNIYKDKGACEYISTMNNAGCSFMQITGDYLYYAAYSGLYRYSLNSGNSGDIETIDESEVISINSYDGTVFYSNKDGVFSCDESGEINKLCDLKAEEIYIFDTEWIYLYNKSGGVYRVKQNGDTVERIIRFDSKAQSDTSEK